MGRKVNFVSIHLSLKDYAVRVLSKNFLLLVALVIGGCSFSGQIGVSQPRVWRQDTIARDAASRIAELKEGRAELNTALTQLAGWRLRKDLIATKLKASVSRDEVSSGTAPKVIASEAKSDTDQKLDGISLQDLNALGKQVGEEALDLLRRQEDFGDLFTGTLLKYIRDDASLTKDYELYLLGFDVSVNGGGWTSSSGLLSSGYKAYVRIEIENAEPYDDVRVYAVAPQQYAERFKEGLTLRNDLNLALALEKSGPGQGGKFALDRTHKSEEQLALIQRYPLISGYVEGAKIFGWTINPRFRIGERGRGTAWLLGKYRTEGGMEDGVRSVLAAIVVKTGSTDKEKRKNKSLKLKVNTYWESVDWHHRIDSQRFTMNVTLPGDESRSFLGATPVHPNSGPGNIDNIVTIKGQDFGARADVYVGTMKACEVKVLSRKYIEVKLPKCFKDQGCSGSPLDIKVISQGDSYLHNGEENGDAKFTYLPPLAEGKEAKLCESGMPMPSPTSNNPGS
jgi:hypothetical protein